ncbi:MAG: transcriptional regulator [Mesorhizobium sp.]|nr:MAG: transcriptional regulator [Mesorhizobium sp.]
MVLTPGQCRAARALVDWSREYLAEQSKISHRTIVDFEREARDPRDLTKNALRASLERAGVKFLAEGEAVEGGPGVRLAAQK